MVGQGGPHSSLHSHPAQKHPLINCSAAARLLWLFVFTGVLLLQATGASAQNNSLQLRITWGGPQARQWLGRMRVAPGRLVQARGLALEADAPGSIRLQEGVIEIRQRATRTYDGFDVVVEAPLHAQLSLDLLADGKPESARRLDIPLSELVSSKMVQLDELGTQLLIQRSPGDQLRLLYERDHLVFAPGEAFQVQVVPHLTGIAGERHVRCQLQLRSVRGGQEELWGEVHEVALDSEGSAPPVGPLLITMPAREGVYELVASLTQRRLTAPFTPKLLLQRTLQFVVIDPAAPVAGSQPDWERVEEIDPARPSWRERLRGLPKWKVLPGIEKGPLGEQAQLVTHDKRQLMQLAPAGWQAYPLSVADTGKPHILSVEYPANLKQTLGISIVEPDASGNVRPIGLDSGVHVPSSMAVGEETMQWHRLIFWPRTQEPLVLLSNPQSADAALFGRIRVEAGPAALEPALDLPPLQEGRLLAAYFDKPLFPENFSAPDALDRPTGRSFDDWQTFYEGGRRLIDYLKHVGYNGAVVTVLCDGSTIYPSQLLEPTPKYDMGVYFATGQDPRRKDVLEMLLRMFDREGLRLIPALQFAAPLPELEQQLQFGRAQAVGIALVDERGMNWPQRHGSRGGLAPYYNPLDGRVQLAMRRVTFELVHRYRHHPSFRGVALQMSPSGYVQLPDESWGCDQRTMDRFATELELPILDRQRITAAERIRFLREEGRDLWLQWRATELAEFYGQLQRDLVQQRPDARLYLAGAELLSSRPVQETLRPALPERVPVDEALRRLGIDLKLLADHRQIVFLRPQRTTPLVSLSAQAVDVELRTAPEADRYFEEHKINNYLHYHEPVLARLPAFDAVSPFGADKTETLLVSQFSPGSHHSRRRLVHSLATSDPETLFDGGWMMPLGQEESLRNVIELYRRLPAERFHNIEPVGEQDSLQPVTVRTFTSGQQTYLYVVNDSPWPTSVNITLKIAGQPRMESLTSRPLPALVPHEGHSRLTIQLPAYEVAGAIFHAAPVKVDSCVVQTDDAARQQLLKQIHEIKARIAALKNPPPLAVLKNPGFELEQKDGQLVGWTYQPDSQTAAVGDAANPYSGTKSLRLTSRGPIAQVYSEPIAAPATGRLSMMVWLRLADAQQQPHLRLVIKWTADGEPHTKFAIAGQGPNAMPIGQQWGKQAYLAQFDDLPLTGLNDVRVGFELVGPGEVWIDDVQLFDIFFQDPEKIELLKNMALAQMQLEEGRLADCQRCLEGYWPRFLLSYVPLDQLRVAEAPQAPEAVARRVEDASSQPQRDKPESSSAWERVRGALPKWPF